MSDEKDGKLGFVHMPGAQGLETQVGRPMPVFGSDEEEGSVLLPDARMTRGHFVVFPKAFLLQLSEEERAKVDAKIDRSHPLMADARVVGRVGRNREPVNPVSIREGKLVVPSKLIPGANVASGQAAFYVASNELRAQFVEFSKATMAQVDKDVRSMATLVTIVGTGIHARPVGGDRPVEARPMTEDEERGFEVVAEFKQFVTVGMPYREIQEYKVYSETGEYPVWVPKDVEMGILLRMDKEVMVNPPEIKRGMTAVERAARLLAQIKKV